MRIRTMSWLLAALALTAAGCFPLDEFGVRTRLASLGGRRYVELTSTRDAGRISMDTCICFFPDGSFEFELEAGDFRDAGEAALTGVTGGVELAVPGAFPPAIFAGVSFRPVSGGTQVYSYSNQSAPGTHGSAFFPGTRRVHIRIERDGAGLLSYSSRPVETDPWTPIGSTNMAGSTDRLGLSLGMFGAPKKAQLGFSGLRIARIGSLPLMPRPELSLEYASYETLGDLLREYDELEDFLEENADLPPSLLDGLDKELDDLQQILDIVDLVEFAGKRPTVEAKIRAAVTKEVKFMKKAAGLARAGKGRKAIGPMEDAIKAHMGWIRTMRSGL